MDPHFLTKVYLVSHSDKNIVEFKDFCLQLHGQAGCTKEECDTGTIKNLLPSFLDKPEKTVKERAEFLLSIARCLKKNHCLIYLICSNHYHDLICNKSSCKISDYLNVANIILLSGLSKEEKISEFQKYCRNYYQNFLCLHFYLKGFPVLAKEKEEEKNGDNK